MRSPFITALIRIKRRFVSRSVQRRRAAVSPADYLTFIDSLPEPENLIDRSYYQYLCHKRRGSIGGPVVRSIANIASIPFLAWVALPRKGVPGSSDPSASGRAVFLGAPSVSDRIPDSLKREYPEIAQEGSSKLLFTAEGSELVRKIWRAHPISFLFALKCGIRIAEYAGIISQNRAAAVIVTSEDSYTSSVLTEYCRGRGVAHINIMHGEIIYDPARSFFSFDACYVWDEYYRGLCMRMRADKGQFVVELPSGLLYRESHRKAQGATYYLQNQDADCLRRIKHLLDSWDMDYRIRPHVIWTDAESVRQVFPAERIESPEDVSIEDSIMGSEVLISQCSTVLYQGYLNGKSVIVDDLSNPSLFRWMRDSGYVMVEKAAKGECLLLSRLIDGGACVDWNGRSSD